MYKFWKRKMREIATISAIISAISGVMVVCLTMLEQTKPNDCQAQPAIEKQLDIAEKTQAL